MRPILAAALIAACLAGPAFGQQSGLTRTELQRQEFPPGFVSETFMVSIAPNATVARHTHPGVELGYLLSGHGTFIMQGQADRAVKAGDSWSVPNGVPHSLRNSADKMKIVVTYVVQAGKPLATPAPE